MFAPFVIVRRAVHGALWIVWPSIVVLLVLVLVQSRAPFAEATPVTDAAAGAAAQPNQPSHRSPVLADTIAVDPHADLPTRFGDEDDVIQRKLQTAKAQAAAAAAAAVAASASASATSAVKVPSAGGFHTKKPGGGSPFGRSRVDDVEDDEDAEEEHYDDDDDADEGGDDEDDEADHRRRTDDSEYKSSVDYAEESELGPTLDNFGAAHTGGSDDAEALPFFLSEPQSTYVIRSRAAVLKCKAANALQVSEITGSITPLQSIFQTRNSARVSNGQTTDNTGHWLQKDQVH